MKKKDKKTKIMEGWKRISEEYHFSGLTERQKALFEKAQFEEEQAKKTPFVLGEPIEPL